MAIDAIVIENLIKEAFPDAEVKVDGADGVHMSAIVASSIGSFGGDKIKLGEASIDFIDVKNAHETILKSLVS